VPAGHREGFDDDEEWFTAPDSSALGRVESVNPEAFKQIQAIAPWWQPVSSATAQADYLGNTCESCGVLQGDHYLESEPGGAFWPETPREAERIVLTWVDTPLEARCGRKSMGVNWMP
jgi:hypothetical protein